MVNRLVSVDEDNNLPSEVQEALIQPVRNEFQALTTQAIAAATVAQDEGDRAALAAQEAANAAIQAVEAASQASAPTQGMVDAAVAPLRAATAISSQEYLIPGWESSQDVELGQALAAAAASPTKTLALAPGEYLIDNTVTVPPGVTLRGLSGSTIRTTANGQVLNISSGVTIDSVRFVGTNPVGGTAVRSGQTAIRAQGASGTDPLVDFAIINCRFEGFEGSTISMRYVQRWRITGNFLADTGNSAVALLCGRDGLIDSNIFRGTGVLPSYSVNSYAISLSLLSGTIDPVTNYPPVRINVTNNIATNQAWEAFDTHGGDDMVFANNNIYGCEMGIAITQKENLVDGGPSQIVVADNVINAGDYPADRVRSGMSINGATSEGSTKLSAVSITGNIIKGHGVSMNHPAQASSRGGSITMNAIASAVVSNNILIDSLGNALSFRDMGTVTASNNVIQTVWRESGDTSRTSAFVYTSNSSLLWLTNNTVSVVPSTKPNRNESTIRSIGNNNTIRQNGNSWVFTEPLISSGSWTLQTNALGSTVESCGSLAYLRAAFLPPSSSNSPGSVIGSTPIRASITARLIGANDAGNIAPVDVNAAGNIVLRGAYNSALPLYIHGPYPSA